MFAFALQATPYLLPEIFGEKAVVLLPLALSVAFFEDESTAVIFGAFCGMAADLASCGNIGYFAISLTVICFVISVLSGYVKRNFLSALAAGAAAALLILPLAFYGCADGSGGGSTRTDQKARAYPGCCGYPF